MFSDKDKQRILSYFEHKKRPPILEAENAALKEENNKWRSEYIRAWQLVLDRNAELKSIEARVAELEAQINAMHARAGGTYPIFNHVCFSEPPARPFDDDDEDASNEA